MSSFDGVMVMSAKVGNEGKDPLKMIHILIPQMFQKICQKILVCRRVGAYVFTAEMHVKKPFHVRASGVNNRRHRSLWYGTIHISPFRPIHHLNPMVMKREYLTALNRRN
jgi:hypothetical protein